MDSRDDSRLISASEFSAPLLGEGGLSKEGKKERMNRREKCIKIAVVVTMVCFLVGVGIDSLTTKYVYSLIQKLNAFVLDSHYLGLFYLAGILYVFMLLGIPVTLFLIGGGYAFSSEFGDLGIPINIAVGFVGCYSGSVTAFLISRYLLREYFRGYIRRNNIRVARAIDIAMKKEGIKMALMLRMVPYLPWNIFNYISGVTSMEFRMFLGGGIAMFPWLTVCSLIGSGLNSIDDAASGTNSTSISPTLNLWIVGFGATMTITSSCLITKYAKAALKDIQKQDLESRASESSIVFSVDVDAEHPSRPILDKLLREVPDEESDEGGAGEV